MNTDTDTFVTTAAANAVVSKSYTDLILDQVKAEREYQIDKWGTEADLKVNTPMDFVGYIAKHSTKWFPGGFRPYDEDTLYDFRASMFQVAAIAVAAIEATDAILDGVVERDDVLVS